MNAKPPIHSNPDISGGTLVFIGTRVPVQTLLDYLEGGESLETFLDHFPSVGREQAIAVLQERFQGDDISWSRNLKRLDR